MPFSECPTIFAGLGRKNEGSYNSIFWISIQGLNCTPPQMVNFWTF